MNPVSDNTTTLIAGVLLIAVPIAFNAAFAALAAKFDYPNILRKPTADVLARFHAGGSALVLLWWGFAMTAALLTPLAILVSLSLDGVAPAILFAGAAVGVLASAVQFLGLVRWPFLVPYLARESAHPDITPARHEAIDMVFQSFNRYLGVAVGEHLGFLFTGAWTALIGVGDPAELQRARIGRGCRHPHRYRSRALLLRVRRPLRDQGMEARRRSHPRRLHRLVTLADGHRHRASAVTYPQLRTTSMFRSPRSAVRRKSDPSIWPLESINRFADTWGGDSHTAAREAVPRLRTVEAREHPVHARVAAPACGIRVIRWLGDASEGADSRHLPCRATR